MEKLRILLITNKTPPDFDGGYELRAFQIAQALRARGHDLAVATSRYRPTFRGEKSDPPWVHRIFRYVLVSQSKTVWRKIDRVVKRVQCTSVARENLPAMEAFLRQHHDGSPYDIAYCFGLHRISYGVLQPLMQRGLPILHHAGGAHIMEHTIKLPREVPGYGLALNLFAKKWYALEKAGDFRNIAFVSEFLRDSCAENGLKPARTFVIPRGIDFPLGTDVERARRTPPVFMMACQIDPQKGPHIVITAAGLLQRKRPELDWRLEIAGVSYTDYQDRCIAQAAAEGIGERVAFIGHLKRADVVERMRQATAFVSASIYGEPFAGTIIEALGSGTTLIGAKSGSILEVVKADESAQIRGSDPYAPPF